MSVSLRSAIIPYTPPLTPMEFIRSEVERGKQQMSRQIIVPSLISPFDLILIGLFLSRVSAIVDEPLIEDESRKFTFSSSRFDIISIFFQVTSSKKLKYKTIGETSPAEASFTIATDKKPVVATYGGGSCVALGGYEATNKIAFIVLFSNAGEVKESGSLMYYNIAKLVKEKITSPIQLHLRGGIKGKSEPIIEAIKLWMEQREDLPMEIASEDTLSNDIESKISLSIDSRTGKVSDHYRGDFDKVSTIIKSIFS